MWHKKFYSNDEPMNFGVTIRYSRKFYGVRGVVIFKYLSAVLVKSAATALRKHLLSK